MEERAIMVTKPGIIVIDGPDGTGKATVAKNVLTLLNEQKVLGHQEVLTQSFPNYDSFYGKLVRAYLDGDSAPELLKVPNDIRNDPICASVMYAMDRYRTYVEFMRSAMEAGHWFLCDRYYTSNMAHQGSRLSTIQERREFWDRLMWLETRYCQLPEPVIVIILELPEKVRSERTERRRAEAVQSGSIGGKISTTDIHEQDSHHMRQTAAVYKQMARYFDWPLISGVENNRELSESEMTQRVYQTIIKSLSL